MFKLWGVVITSAGIQCACVVLEGLLMVRVPVVVGFRHKLTD